MPSADQANSQDAALPGVESAELRSARFARSILEKDEAASIAKDGSVTARVPANTRRIESWQNRRLDFESEPLSEAISQVNRYTTRALVLGRPELAQIRISGVFQIAELEGFTFALQQSFGLRVVDRGNERVVLPEDGD